MADASVKAVLYNGQCAKCKESKLKMYKCSKCLTARYCGEECQKAHWREHKKKCSPANTDEIKLSKLNQRLLFWKAVEDMKKFGLFDKLHELRVIVVFVNDELLEFFQGIRKEMTEYQTTFQTLDWLRQYCETIGIQQTINPNKHYILSIYNNSFYIQQLTCTHCPNF